MPYQPPSDSRLELFSQRIAPTETFDTLDAFIPAIGSAYVFSSTDESRSTYLTNHVRDAGVSIFFIEEKQDGFEINIYGNVYEVSLYSHKQLASVWELISSEIVYLDITGLSHHVWAPLIDSANRQNQHIQAIYVEPADYQRAKDPAQSYDLSESITGIQPLPGFINLQLTDDDICFVPILGFEGARLKYAVNKIDLPANNTYPIIGLPGFRPEYPFETYKENRWSLLTLDNGQLPYFVQYADASCPFKLFYTLEDIAAKQNQNTILKIALLGTKPHALGAVIYTILTGRNRAELIYDHPKRKKGRTSGNGRFYVFHVSFFLDLMNSQSPE